MVALGEAASAYAAQAAAPDPLVLASSRYPLHERGPSDSTMVPDVTLLLLTDQNSEQKRRVHGPVGDEAEVLRGLHRVPDPFPNEK